MIICNDAYIDGENRTGEPTELALIEAALQAWMSKGEAESDYPRVFELPFDSERKMMSTVHDGAEGRVLFAKGALESILPKVVSIEKNGEIAPFTEQEEKIIEDQVSQLSEKAYRVLSLDRKSTRLNSSHVAISY